MFRLFSISVVILSLAEFNFVAGQTACPFNNQCQCNNQDPNVQTTYQSSVCTTPDIDLPDKQGSTMYAIKETMTISPNIDIIQANSFLKSLTNIGFLNLTQQDFPQSSQKWDQLAFRGINISGFSVQSLSKVIPPPPALTDLGPFLQSLSFIKCGDTVKLTSKIFEKFSKLQELRIDATKISSIDPSAFSGLENTLQELTLASASISTYPASALNILKQLKYLNLMNNGMSTGFPANAFEGFPNLEELTLSGNDVQAAMNAGAFDNLPATTTKLYLENGNLAAFPKDPIANVKDLSVALNKITRINENDCQNGTNLLTLRLTGNPIELIHPKAFRYLESVRQLFLTGVSVQTDPDPMTSFDLSTLNGMKSLEYLALDQNSLLRILGVTDVTQVPTTLATITVAKSGLDTISSTMQPILDRPQFKNFDFSDNTHVTCDWQIDWMARYALCAPVKVNITNSKCFADGVPLESYFREKLNTCDFTTTTTTTTTTAPATTSSAAASSSSPGTDSTASTGSSAATTSAGTGSSDTTSAQTTPQSASSITANIFIIFTLAIIARNF